MNCYCAVVTKGGYVDIAKVLLHSLKANGGLKVPFVVITSKTGKYAISTKEKSILKKAYGNVKYHYIDVEKYHANGKDSPKFWSIEIFNMPEYDNIIFMDADCLCTGSMEGLLSYDYKLGMTRERQRPNFSAGLIVANRWYRNPNTYKQLIKCVGDKGRFGHDQRVYNTFFGEASITEIDRKWHCKVDELERDAENYSLIHYWLKPTDKKHRPRLSGGLIDLWERYAKCASK